MFERIRPGSPRAAEAPGILRLLILAGIVALLGTGVSIAQEQETPPPEPETTEAAPEADEAPEAVESALEEADLEVPEADEDAIDEEAIEAAEAEADDDDSVTVTIGVEDDEGRRSRRSRRTTIDKDTQVHFMSDLEIDDDEVAREAVVVMGSLHVKGKVLGDTVSVIGATYIDGEVTGTVTAVLDSVYLGPNSEVLGDVVSVGGSVEIEPGARVLGEVSEVDFGPALHFSQPWYYDHDWDFWDGAPLGLAWSVFWTVFRWIVLILITSFIFLVARQAVEQTASAVSAEPWKAGFLGLATWLLFFPLMVVATIVLLLSIIGIPLLIIVWPLGLFVLMIACLLGYTSSAFAVGSWLGRRFDWSLSPYLALMIGVVAIQGLSLVGEMFGSLGGFFWFFALMFGLAGWAVRFSAWTAGLGAVIMVYAERRRGGATPPPAVESSPPPAPATDPLVGSVPVVESDPMAGSDNAVEHNPPAREDTPGTGESSPLGDERRDD